jgi:hypothetical protein
MKENPKSLTGFEPSQQPLALNHSDYVSYPVCHIKKDKGYKKGIRMAVNGGYKQKRVQFLLFIRVHIIIM